MQNIHIMPDKKNRPKIEVQPTPTDISVELLSFFALITQMVLMAYYYPKLPEIVPTHFGFTGKPDAWGSKSMLWLTPVISVVIYGVFTVINRYPHTFNYPVEVTTENAQRLYTIAVSMIRWMKLESILIFLAIDWNVIQIVLGNVKTFSMGFPLAITGVMIITTIIGLIKTYQAR